MTAITGTITFFYYEDLPRAAAFYEAFLQRTPATSTEWVHLFSLAGGASLGLVGGGGSLRPAKDKPVMLSLIAENRSAVDDWHGRARRDRVPIIGTPKVTRVNEAQSFYGFICEDCEGYAIEVLCWLAS
ncbi:VOC family protein [Pacificimonas sp. WHA3]|uniref:VOC family protein n=1 Tax=Pacificimonas pallii TaxID=2827236 RepID=A0ABS6SGF3_9SPHN|nr:VOC family protein [Pacificimonas pallii]MBV7257497.1 VOC family protein [Pacificimonas pallii]